jgi:hypothetical protein
VLSQKTGRTFVKISRFLEKLCAPKKPWVFLKNFALQKTLRFNKNYAHFGKISQLLEKLCTPKNLALLRKTLRFSLHL